MDTIPESVLQKALDALNQWACDFMIVGNGGNETPRYSQLMTREGVFVLKSTQKDLFYDLNLTPEEHDALDNVEHYSRWAQWKEARTAHLLTHFKTIKPY